MIRRLLSLVAGALALWAMYALYATFVAGMSASALIIGASAGASAFFAAVLPALLGCLVIGFLLSRLWLVKRLWMNLGAIVVAAALCLFALVFFGSGLVA